MSDREHKPGKKDEPKAADPEPDQQRPAGGDSSLLEWRLSHGRSGGGPYQQLRDQRRALGDNLAHRFFRKPAGSAPAGNPAIPQSGGAPLGGDVRTKMEGQLGADLSGVKVHTGAASAGAAADMNARAFAVGQDVHFGAGEFKPGTKEGDKLIAHELTHTVQAQKSGVQRKAEPEGGHEGKDGNAGAEVSDPNEPAEKEADSVADGVADKLHGGDKAKKGGAEAAAGPDAKGDEKSAGAKGEVGQERAPQIGAKLEPGVIPLARKDDTPRPAAPTPGAAKPKNHRTNIHVQGNDMKSIPNVAFSQPDPVSKAQGLTGLNTVKGQCSPRQMRDRNKAFEKAAAFIASTLHTTPPPLFRTFQNPEVIGDPQKNTYRVDIEIIEGTAFK